jgi:ABC-type molybdate transport system ATPase subunit
LQQRLGASMLLVRITGSSFDALGLQPGRGAWLQVNSVALLQ